MPKEAQRQRSATRTAMGWCPAVKRSWVEQHQIPGIDREGNYVPLGALRLNVR
jgi:hypothetical protein